MKLSRMIAALVAMTILYCPAHAQFISELRVGVEKHDIELTDGRRGVEDGANFQVELLFEDPEFFKYLLSPRPYAHANINSAGDTFFAGGGLSWQSPEWRDRYYTEFQLGIIYHDGFVDLPEATDPRFNDLVNERIFFGSRFQFHLVGAVGIRITERIDWQAYYQHVSHGQILGNGRNPGLDTVGMRVGYRFGQPTRWRR